jgi:glycosyltransferase involved in cell wall biosynthesis
MADSRAPDVSVIVATRNREELLEKALSSILAQDYEGDIEVIVVYDQEVPQHVHEQTTEHRKVRVVTNTRRPGLAGARNTGILLARGKFIAFCDDDDSWRPQKVRRQSATMQALHGLACVSGISVHYNGREHTRVPDVDYLTVESLSRSRMTGAHPSTYFMDRQQIGELVGMIDEDIPGGYGEDYDWLLRMAAAEAICVVREPLVDVLWHRGSYFASRWETIVDALDYVATKHPSIVADRRGKARLLGQQAFALAALGQTSLALRTAGKALLNNPAEPRAYLVPLVSSRLVSAGTVVHAANSRGRGI